MKLAINALTLILATAVTPSLAHASTNRSISVSPFEDISVADSTEIDELEGEFFLVLQSEGTLATFNLVTDDENALRMFKVQADQLDYLCPTWDSISAGRFETLSRDTHQRFYYSISGSCHVRWDFIFRRTGDGWAISNIEFRPSGQWK